jgi:chromosomal replication initiation ATPase DnaA
VRQVLQATAATFSVPIRKLRARRRGNAAVVFARQCAMYLAHVVLGLSYSEIGRIFRRERTTARHACRLVEERREEPAIDRTLEKLERACAGPARDGDESGCAQS